MRTWKLAPAVLHRDESSIFCRRYSLLREAAVARKHAAAGSKAGRHTRQEELPIGASLLVAAVAGAGNVLLTNPIW